MNLLKRGIATLVTTSVALLALPTTPAFALDGPVARADGFSKDGRGIVTGNVLTNDSWDAGHTATLTKVDVLSAEIANLTEYLGNGSEPITVDYVMNPNGEISVDFGPYTRTNVPSGYRVATLRYEFTDSAGQRSVALAQFRDSVAVADTSLTDDDNDTLHINDPEHFWTFETDRRLPILDNDTLSFPGAYTYEIVSQSLAGSITFGAEGVRYTPPATPGLYTETFSYRVCPVSTPGVCTTPAQVTFNANVKAPPAPMVNTYTNKAFWLGGPTSYAFDPVADARAQLTLEPNAIPAGTTAVLRPAARNHVVVSDLGGGRFGYSYTGEYPATTGGPAIQEEPIVFDLVNSNGDTIGQHRHDVAFVPPLAYGADAPLVRDDDAWVKVGTDFQVPVPFANDRLSNSGLTADEWIGAPVGYDATTHHPHLLSSPQLGLFGAGAFAGGGTGGVSVGVSPWYRAGNVAGIDVVRYEVCAPYPARSVECSDGVIRIHVSPVVAAADDVRNARPGDTLVVPVLGNDTYTDTPAKGADVLVLTDVPAGVQARVLNDREVEVRVPAGFKGDAFAFGYRVTDFTGAATARVVVNVERITPDLPPPVVVPPVVDPPVVDPPVVVPPVVPPVVDPEPVVAPTAKDDHSKATVGFRAIVPVLANDTYQGDAVVSPLTRKSTGWKVHETRDGRFVFAVSPAFKGDTIKMHYRVTDETGLSDEATVTVKVTRPVAVPPVVKAGGVFDLDGIQSGDTTEDAVVATVSAAAVAPTAGGHRFAMLTGWALLTLVGAAIYRRKVRRA